MNPVEYIKNHYFDKIKENIAIISDWQIITKKDFYKIDIKEAIWDILSLSEKYDFIFVILDKLNYDNIYRLYKYNLKNICIINLNAWYTWMWKKFIFPDLEDIYIKPSVKVLEIMDIVNLDTYIYNFFQNPKLTYIRLPYKEMERKIWWEELDMDYENIINFNQFWIFWYSWTIISYGSMLQESINVAWLLQEDGLNIDLFWVGNYKKEFSTELIKSLEDHDKVFIIWDFDKSIYKDFLYSRFASVWIQDIEVYFITPENIKPTIEDFLSEQVWMSSSKVYERIKEKI